MTSNVLPFAPRPASPDSVTGTTDNPDHPEVYYTLDEVAEILGLVPPGTVAAANPDIEPRPDFDRIPADAKVYTVKEVAGMLRLSLGATYAMLREGRIPAKLIGRRWIIPRDRFTAWLTNLPDGDEHPDAPDAVYRTLHRPAAG